MIIRLFILQIYPFVIIKGNNCSSVCLKSLILLKAQLMKKIILITSVLLLVIIWIARLYFISITGGNRSIEKSLESIPADASIIFQFTNDKGFYELFNGYTLFDDVIGNSKKTELIFLKNQLASHKRIAALVDGQNLFLSLHHDKADSVSFLWIMPLKENWELNDFFQDLKNTDSITYRIINTDKALSINILQHNKTCFYLIIKNGIAVGSYSENLLKAYFDEKGEKISVQFIKSISKENLKNQNSPANVFINLKALGLFLKTFYKSESTVNSILNNELQSYASLNMNFKNDALVFNGLVYADTSKLNYNTIFLHQAPIKNTIVRIAPDNTSTFLAYSLSDNAIFKKDIRALLAEKKEWIKLNENLTQINTETGINLEKETTKLWSNEFITFQLSTQEKYGAIKLTNGEQMGFVLEPLSDQYTDKIKKLRYADILYTYFGDPFKPFQKPYYTILDNYLIFSNSAVSMQHFLNSYTKERVLYKTKSYIQFNRSVADVSTLFLFVHNYNSNSNYKSYLKPAFAGNWNNPNFGINKFYGFSCQLSSNSTHFFANVLAEYKILQESDESSIDTLSSLVR